MPAPSDDTIALAVLRESLRNIEVRFSGQLDAERGRSGLLHDQTKYDLASFQALWRSEHLSLKDRLEQSQRNSDKATDAIAADITRRFEGVNEFRQTLSDQAGRFISRDEVFTLIGSVRDRVDALGISMAAITSAQSGKKEGWGLAIGMLSVILTIITIVSVVLFRKT